MKRENASAVRGVFACLIGGVLAAGFGIAGCDEQDITPQTPAAQTGGGAGEGQQGGGAAESQQQKVLRLRIGERELEATLRVRMTGAVIQDVFSGSLMGGWTLGAV